MNALQEARNAAERFESCDGPTRSAHFLAVAQMYAAIAQAEALARIADTLAEANTAEPVEYAEGSGPWTFSVSSSNDDALDDCPYRYVYPSTGKCRECGAVVVQVNTEADDV